MMSRKELVIASAEKVAAVIGVEPGTLARNDRGIVLSPNQIDKLTVALIKQGWKNAASTLKEAGEAAKADGSSLTRVAAFATGANFLDDQIELAKQYES